MKAEDREVIHIRMPRKLIKRLDHYAVDTDMFRDRAVSFLVELALDSLGYEYKPHAKDARDGC